MTRREHFGSDNYAGVCPEALGALLDANASGHHTGYGDDAYTERACDRIRALFATDCDVFFVFNGSAANALSLASICQSYHAIVCSAHAHVEHDECGGPEFFTSGAKLLVAPGDTPAGRLGKLSPEALEQLATKRSDLHFPKAAALTLTQATELGTVYAPDELRAICAVARRHALKVHMDGARFANAVAHLGCEPADITWRAGIDVLSFGGTKNGLAVGDAVVFFERSLSRDFEYRLKQAGQLASKMRFIAAPWIGLVESGAWLANARHANAMAERLHGAIRTLPGVRVMHPPEANGVFAYCPKPVIDAMHAAGWKFYEFLPGGGCRFMCAWDTTAEAVDAFAADLARCCSASG